MQGKIIAKYSQLFLENVAKFKYWGTRVSIEILFMGILKEK
jgi:hypothetical protein